MEKKKKRSDKSVCIIDSFGVVLIHHNEYSTKGTKSTKSNLPISDPSKLFEILALPTRTTVGNGTRERKA